MDSSGRQDVDYDQLASVYHQRYKVNRLEGVAALLRGLVLELNAHRVLEVGCGTGRWLAELTPLAAHVIGLDSSAGMLRQAQALDASGSTRTNAARASLVCVRGQAGELPFSTACLDLVFCVNALHHFPEPARFVAEARRLLRPGGALAVIALDPHNWRDNWYVYDYFPGTRETDLARFPSAGRLLDWMAGAGFERATWQLAERIDQTLVGREVWQDHFLKKEGTSQLALLSDEAYRAGLARLEAALEAAAARGETLKFSAGLRLGAVVGYAPAYLASMRAMR
jgi:SAM-dependent methyltransferase